VLFQNVDNRLVDICPDNPALAKLRTIAVPGVSNAVENRHRAIYGFQNIEQADLRRRPGEHIPPFVPPHTLEQGRALQGGGQLREVELRKVFPFSNVFESDGLAVSVFGDVGHHADGISGPGVDSHASEYIGLINSLNIEPLPLSLVRDLGYVTM